MGGSGTLARLVAVLGATSAIGLVACSLLLDSGDLSGAPDVLDGSVEDRSTPSDDGASSDAGGDTAVSADAPFDGPLPSLGCDGGGDPALVGYWPLDEDSGTVAHDCSGRGHDGTVLNAPGGGGWTAGVFGGGWHADGTSGCIDLGVPSDLLVENVAFTVTAWASFASFAGPGGGSRYLVGRSHSGDISGWRVAGDSPSHVDLEIGRAGDAGPSFAGTSDGQPTLMWMHLAAVFEPSVRTSFYVNGVLIQNRPQTVASILEDTTATVRIGCRADTDRYFDGVIDEVRLYRRALTVQEIATLAAR